MVNYFVVLIVPTLKIVSKHLSDMANLHFDLMHFLSKFVLVYELYNIYIGILIHRFLNVDLVNLEKIHKSQLKFQN